MAFLAIVALCVSPAFAWSCCCSAAQTTVPARPSAKIGARMMAPVMPHCVMPCCANDHVTPPQAQVKSTTSASHIVNATGSVSIVKSKCECSHDDASPVVSGVTAHSFSAPVALAMPIRALAFSFEEDARFAPCFHIAARPRSPGWRSSPGRGPPTFSS